MITNDYVIGFFEWCQSDNAPLIEEESDMNNLLKKLIELKQSVKSV